MELTKQMKIGLETYREKFEGNNMLVPTNIPKRYQSIYLEFPEELRYIFSYIHYQLDNHIQEANTRYKKYNNAEGTNRESEDCLFYYRSADSSGLLDLISDYRDIKELLKTSIIINVSDEYNDFMVNMQEELQVRGGNNVYKYREYSPAKFVPIFTTIPKKQYGNVMNIIFAAKGPKPEIVLSDAIENKIDIVKHREHCLVYDLDIQNNNLTWGELDSWWKRDNNTKLSTRLSDIYKSNDIEKIFLEHYINYCSKKDNPLIFPALIPEVYLHYDPKTIKQLEKAGQSKRLQHQRMDFLMLINGNRVIIELDGKQHYSKDGKPSPEKYAEMVSYDRKMKLLGYEVYRFGGHEFNDSNLIENLFLFFDKLLNKYAPHLNLK